MAPRRDLSFSEWQQAQRKLGKAPTPRGRGEGRGTGRDRDERNKERSKE